MNRSRNLFLMATAVTLLGLTGCAMTPKSSFEDYAANAINRDNVHIFLINSPFDPVNVGGVRSLRKYLQKQGFENAYYYRVNISGKARMRGSKRSVAQHVMDIRHRNPNAKVLVYGFSAGSLYGMDAMNELGMTGVRIDTAMYVDSTFLRFAPPHPPNIDRITLVYRKQNCIPVHLPHAVVYPIKELSHLSVPTDKEAVDALMLEALRLAEMGGAVSVPESGCACLGAEF